MGNGGGRSAQRVYMPAGPLTYVASGQRREVPREVLLERLLRLRGGGGAQRCLSATHVRDLQV